MKDRVVLISGASGGLGTTVTDAFIKTGARVIGAARRITCEEFPQPNFEPLVIDFNHNDEIRLGIARMIERYARLDVLVHVLGGFAGGQSVAETTDATWEQMQNLNLTSAFRLFREVIPHLRKSNDGRLIAIGSLTATQPHANLAAYVTFKAALTLLVQTVALENADVGMTANIILPGTMDTAANRKSMPDADRSSWVKTEDVAELVLSLADERAKHLTGLAIPLEGHHG